MNPNTTLKEMSQLLELSISTISRALKDHPDISIATKRKVRELAKMMEYEPNAFAVNLRTNKSKLFGLIVPVISNYFYDSLISSLAEEARLNGYSLLILQSGDDPEIEKENVKLCKQNRVAGIFVSITKDTTDISFFLKLADNDIQVVFIDKVPKQDNCIRICVADVAAASIAAEALAAKRKKNILAIFGNNKLSITQERLKGFTTFFEKQVKKVKIDFKESCSLTEAYQTTIDRCSKSARPDAVFCMSDEILAGVMKALQELRLDIPVDIGVIAISNGLLPKIYYPEITYVETSGSKLGKLAHLKMMGCLAGNCQAQHLQVESIFVKGASL
jgi:LacI family transcriptional regulator